MSKIARAGLATALLALAAGGFFLAEYLAGVAYFVVSKTSPADAGLDTWRSYWHWYSDDPVQRKRLQLAAGLAALLVYGAPLLAYAKTRGTSRPLHGDARFARASEIHKAGLNAESGVIVG